MASAICGGYHGIVHPENHLSTVGVETCGPSLLHRAHTSGGLPWWLSW